jgi:FixJ family two-component response regulator
MERGAFDYLTKPINIQDVKNKVKSAMDKNVLSDDE